MNLRTAICDEILGVVGCRRQCLVAETVILTIMTVEKGVLTPSLNDQRGHLTFPTFAHSQNSIFTYGYHKFLGVVVPKN